MNQIQEAVQKSMEQELPCVICGKATRNRGVFVPDDSQKSGLGQAPKGKTRMVIYSLCEEHPQNQETRDAVETYIASQNGSHHA